MLTSASNILYKRRKDIPPYKIKMNWDVHFYSVDINDLVGLRLIVKKLIKQKNEKKRGEREINERLPAVFGFVLMNLLHRLYLLLTHF